MRSLDPAIVLALASFLVTLAKTMWDVCHELTKSRSEPLSPGEVALLREMLAERVRQGAPPSEEIPGKLRIAAVEAAIDEAVEETKRLERRR